jgi:hypothetical protein
MDKQIRQKQSANRISKKITLWISRKGKFVTVAEHHDMKNRGLKVKSPRINVTEG